MASETTVGSIVGFFRMDADQAHRELERAIAEVDRLDGKSADVRVSADTGKAQAEMRAASAEADRLDRSTVRLNRDSRDTGRGMGALATAILTLGPAVVPLATATVGLAAGFSAMGAAGVAAIFGIRHEMQQGSATGQAFSTALDSAKGNLTTLATVAAKGVLRPFQDTVANLSRMMPDLSRMMGEFGAVTGRVGSSITGGLLVGFVALEPLMRDVAAYTYGLSQRFALLMSGPGLVSFGDYVRSVFPQVMQAVESIVGAVIHLVAALAPLGGGVLTALGAFSSLISAIPVDVLSVLATTASSVFLGFKSFGLITGMVNGLSGALVKMGVSAEMGAGGMRALSLAAGAVGAIVAVATFLYTRHAEAVRQNEEAANGYADALRASNGAIDESISKSAAKNLQDAGALQIGRELGVNLRDLTQAALGNADAQARVNDQLAVSKKNAIESAAGNINAADSMGEWQKKADQLTGAIGGQNAALNEGIQKNRDMSAAMQVGASATSAADAAAGQLAGRLGTTTAALQAATTAQKDQAGSAAAALAQMQLENDAAGILKGTLDQLNGKALSAADAQNAFDSSLANMGDHVTSTGKKVHFTTTSINNMSSASVALRGQLNGQVSNLQRVVEANGGLTNSTGKAKAEMVKMRQQIIDNAVAHGVDRKAVTSYIDKLLAIPKKVPPTKLDVDNAAALTKIANLKSALAGLHGKTVQVTVNEQRFVNNGTLPGGGHSTVGGSTKNSANGNVFRAFAGGGFEDHVAQIAPAGAMRLWAEPETGGEAYIPLAPSKRARSQQILAETNRLMGNPLGGPMSLDDVTIAKFAAAMSRIQLRTVVTAGQFDTAMGWS